MLILDLLDKAIKYFFVKKLNVKSVFDTANKCKCRIALAYLGKPCEIIRTQLKELFKKISCCSIQVAYIKQHCFFT